MSNDKTTLADVQPDERVRLGDQPWPEIDAILADAYSAGATGLPFEGIARRHAVRAAVAALPAQPSPGGQGESVTDAMVYAAEEAYANSKPDSLHESFRDAIAAALAARRPVGEPAYNSAGISLTACQLHEALLMAGDPELDVPFEDRSLVRIFCTETGHSGPGLYCECVDAEEEGCILLDGTAPAIGQSAQGVDLPYSLDADPAGIRARVCDVITGTLMVGAQGHTPPQAGHWAQPFWQAARHDAARSLNVRLKLRELVAASKYMRDRVVETRGVKCMDDLDYAINEADKALIDSQGGVGP